MSLYIWQPHKFSEFRSGETKAPLPFHFSVIENFDFVKYRFNPLNRVHICQVSQQLSYGDTCKYELDIQQVTSIFLLF